MAVGRKTIRVVHLITSLNVGGGQMDLFKAVTRFDPARIESTVISLVAPGKIGKLLEERGIPVFSLNMRPGCPNPLAVWRLKNLLDRIRPHLLQTYLYHADLLGYLAGRWAGVPIILWNLLQSRMDFGQYRPTTWFTVWLCARLSRGVRRIVVNSVAGIRAHALLGYDASRMVLIPNGYEVERFRPDPESYREVRQELALPPDTLVVGMLARFDPQKDHATFLRAASLVAKAHPGVVFLMGGNGVTSGNPAFARILRKCSLPGERLRLLGEVSDMPRILAALDLFVSSSAFGEGHPNVVGEAMCCGVPCIVTDVGDCALMVGNTGLVVPPRDAGALARAINQALSWSALERRRRGLAARKRMVSNFEINRVNARRESLYLELTEKYLSPGSN